MKGKVLLLLLLLFGILFGVSQISRNGQRAHESQAAWKSGTRPFAALDLNAAASMTLSKGAASVTLQKQEGSWVVTNLYNYPADFGRLTSLLRGLPELKVGEVISNPTPFLQEYGLLDGSENPPTLLSLQGTDGSSLLQLSLGESRQSSGPYETPGQGQFMRLDDGQVLLMGETLSGAFTDPAQWLRLDLIDLPETNVASISVTLAGESYTLKVNSPGQFELLGLKEGETLKSYEPGRVVRSVQNLQIASIADPDKKDSDYGLREGGTLRTDMKDGRSYTISIGEKTASGKHRYLNIKPMFTPPPKPVLNDMAAQVTDEKNNAAEDAEQDEKAVSSAIKSAYAEAMNAYQKRNSALEKQVAEETAFFANWSFEVLSTTAEAMIIPREDLLDVTEADGVEE